VRTMSPYTESVHPMLRTLKRDIQRSKDVKNMIGAPYIEVDRYVLEMLVRRIETLEEEREAHEGMHPMSAE
jgi:hypothetical protein